MTPSTPDVGTVPIDVPVLQDRTALAHLNHPQTDDETTIAVIADPHIATRAENTWKQFAQTEQLLERAVEKVRTLDVDGAIVLGDLTKDGELWNFNRYDALIESVSAPMVTIPGNHDVPKGFDTHPGRSPDTFGKRYAQGRYPVLKRLGSIDVIGLNTASHPEGKLRDSHGGCVSDQQRRELDQLLSRATTPVVTMHHNLFELPHNPGGAWRNFPLDDPVPLRATLADHDVELVLSGHQHLLGTDQRDGIRELLAPAVCSYPISMLTLHIGPSGTTVYVHPLGGRADQQTAYERAINGNAMGRGIAARAGIAIESLPLVDEGQNR